MTRIAGIGSGTHAWPAEPAAAHRRGGAAARPAALAGQRLGASASGMAADATRPRRAARCVNVLRMPASVGQGLGLAIGLFGKPRRPAEPTVLRRTVGSISGRGDARRIEPARRDGGGAGWARMGGGPAPLSGRGRARCRVSDCRPWCAGTTRAWRGPRACGPVPRGARSRQWSRRGRPPGARSG